MAEMTRAADLLFGSGRYACLGKTVAFLELRKCLATVCFSFSVHLCLSLITIVSSEVYVLLIGCSFLPATISLLSTLPTLGRAWLPMGCFCSRICGCGSRNVGMGVGWEVNEPKGMMKRRIVTK